ncbi:MAG: HAD family hydrolase [Gemmatimonadetes bacterium]|nr:HAD family hydrolase [Gemmatimonadota bacterium]NNF39199.1 HAD family hydrolase [Gemmatimonadota bacterium]
MTAGPGRPAVFLDRDGTLIEDADYLADPEGVVLIAGAADALARLRAAGFALVVVTNQSGIARGRFTEGDYRRVSARLDELLAEGGVALDASLHCPHHPTYSGPCGCRKPAPGMLVSAAGALGLDLDRSWIVGDKVTDLQAGDAAGAAGILVRTGYGGTEEDELPGGGAVVDSIREAADHILASPR